MLLVPQLASPCEVDSLKNFLDNDSWVMEQKLDGHRLLLHSPGADMPPTALTRNGSIYSRKLPKAIQDFRFPEGDWALDGELVDGTFWVFDLPMFQGEATGLSLELRRVALETFLANIRHPFKLVPQARTQGEKISLAARAMADNFEGLILKRVDSPYRPGARTDEWLKVKFVATADCVVLAVRDDGKESVRLGLYAPTGALLEVGRSSLIGKEKRGAINKGDVIECRYLYTGTGNRLYQPTILRKRDDKTPSECTTDQLKFVNKSVLEAL